MTYQNVLYGFKQQALRRKWGLQEPAKLTLDLKGAKQHEWVQPTWGEIVMLYKRLCNVLR